MTTLNSHCKKVKVKFQKRSLIVLAPLFASFNCWAGTSAPFDLGGLVLIALGIILGLFVLIGRTKGFIAFFVLLGGFCLWAEIENHVHVDAAHIARQTISDMCFNKAGEINSPLLYEPERIFVSVDERLKPGSSSGPRTSIFKSEPSENVVFVPSLPIGETVSKAVFVDISVIQEPIKDAKGWYLNGIQTTIFANDKSMIARRTDYMRDFGWCLGGVPPESIEHFVMKNVGRSIGIASIDKHAAMKLPVISLRGVATPIKEGKFSEATKPEYISEDHELKERMTWIPTEANCHFKAGVSLYSAVCMEGEVEENVIDLKSLSTIHRLPTGWLSVLNEHQDVYFSDSLTIVERAGTGAILSNFVIRFPRISTESLGGSMPVVRNVHFDGRHFTADLLFARQLDFGDPRKDKGSYKEWYKYRSILSADLNSN